MILADSMLRARLPDLFPYHHDTLDLDKQLQPASVDLRLGDEFWVFKDYVNPGERIIDLSEDPSSYMERVVKSSFVVRPGQLVLATTEECVAIPHDLVGRVEGRSSLARVGLNVHRTAGYIDPGFVGNVTLEMDVAGPFPLRLHAGMRICQLAVETVNGFVSRPYGCEALNSKYQKQRGATPSRVYRDSEEWT